MAREQLQTLSEPMYFVLLALTRPMHGYEIMQMVAAISQGRVKVGAGTLYALLTRFEKDAIVTRVSDDGRRKIYAISEKGRGLLEREYGRLKEMIQAYDSYTGSPLKTPHSVSATNGKPPFLRENCVRYVPLTGTSYGFLEVPTGELRAE